MLDTRLPALTRNAIAAANGLARLGVLALLLAGVSERATAALTTYTDRAAWEAAVAVAGATVQNLDFTGLTPGRVTALDTDYGDFRIVVDDVAGSSFSNPGIDIFPDASCSLGSGDCQVFTFNMLDSTSVLDGPKINQVIFPQSVVAFGGDFIQVGVTAPSPGSVTGPVTLQIGTEQVVLNNFLTGGNGFFGFIADAPGDTLSLTFAKSGSLQNDIFQVYNPAYANAPVAPSTPEEMITALRETIAAFDLKNGTARKLDHRLRDALKELDKGHTDHACKKLAKLMKDASTESGDQLTPSEATEIIDEANAIREALGC